MLPKLYLVFSEVLEYMEGGRVNEQRDDGGCSFEPFCLSLQTSQDQSPNKGKAAKHPVPHSWWNCSFLPWSSQRLNSLPKAFSFWPNLGTSPTTGRHAITHCLQPIKSPLLLVGRRLCPWSLGLEVLPKRCFAQINLLHFFNLSWSGLLCRQRILLCIGVFHHAAMRKSVKLLWPHPYACK